MEMTKAIAKYIKQYQLDEIFCEETIKHINALTYKAGEIIVHSGDEVDQLFILVKGKIKVSTALPNGRTMLLRFTTPLSLLGDIELIENEQAKVQVECMEGCEFLVIPHRIIHDYEMHRPVFLHYLLNQICTKMSTNFHSATMNILTSVEHRFASYLLSMSGNNTTQPSYRKDELETSKLTEIAEMLGTSYRHLNRIVKKFTEEKLILKEKKKITLLDVDGLKARCIENRFINRKKK